MSDHDGVAAAAAAFYDALNIFFGGEMEPMKVVWSHADDVTYMGPDGGFQVGWRAVLAEWEKVAAMKLGGHVVPEGMRITCGGDLAVVSNYEKGTNTNIGDGPVDVLIRATNIFRRENGAWKMIGHHTDKLSFLA
ncbi:YybH family protein [Methyloligella solikamskensis]|uniref:YybH family protein n=1 Tax=Methyloligella solikamskensis TaxID=1177756 RepID=A0ABW3J8F8_9HYPH